MKRLLAMICLLALCCTAFASAVAGEEEGSTMQHILLLGFDFWGDPEIGVSYSDVNMLISIDEQNQRICITSLMRDTYLERPNGKFGRINGIVKDFGFDAMLDTIELNYGIKVDHYVAIGVQGVRNVIDSIGGVEVTVTKGEAEALAKSSSISRPGTQTLTGKQFMDYVRLRHYASADFSRTERQRDMMLLLYDKAMSMDLQEMLKAAQVAVAEIKTNMSVVDLITLATTVHDIGNFKVETIGIPLKGMFTYETKSNMSVLVLDWEKNIAALNEFLYGK